MSDMLRITGMVTGLDTDELVKNLVSLEQTKLDRVKQDKQYTEWKQEAYRDIINTLRGFKDEYFDFLNPENNLRSAGTFNSYQVTYNGESLSDYLNITATRESTLQNYPITEIITAKRAEATGTVLAGAISGETISAFDISSANDNNKIMVTFNGIKKEIVIADGLSNLEDIRADLQAKLDAAYGLKADGTPKIMVTAANGGLAFSTEKTNSLSLGYAYNAGYEELIGQDLSSGVTLDSQNNKFKLTFNGNTQLISLAVGEYDSTAEVVTETQSQLDSIFGADLIRVLNQEGRLAFKVIDNSTVVTASGSLTATTIGETVEITAGSNDLITINIDGNEETITLEEGSYSQNELLSAIQSRLDSAYGSDTVMVSLDSEGKLRFEAIDQEQSITLAPQENGGLEALGLATAAVSKSNKIDLNANLSDIAGYFQTDFAGNDIDGDGYDIEFTINGQTFAFDSAITSLQDIIDEVNNNEEAGVVMKYDELNDQITIETTETGATTSLTITDVEGNLMAVLGLDGVSTTGSDAVVTFDDGSAEGLTIIRSTNTFTVDGLKFELKEDIADTSIDLKISTDITDTLETIKGFVEKYNEVVTALNEKLKEERFLDYEPLTDAQKEEMSEKEIELWEEKAKSGILKSDSLLEDILYSMRRSLFQEVAGAGISLHEIGITTSSNYLDGGKLIIDEEKLTTALREKPEAVTRLFTQQGDTEESSGLSHRLYDIIQDNIRTTRDTNGRKGILLEKAGIEGDITEFQNTLSEKVDDYDEQIAELLEDMADKEDYYYSMFARMETAIASMNAQSAWLATQFGTGSSSY